MDENGFGEDLMNVMHSAALMKEYGGGMVWGGISLEARTDLVIMERGTITALRYITDCLIDHVVPYAPFIGPTSSLCTTTLVYISRMWKEIIWIRFISEG